MEVVSLLIGIVLILACGAFVAAEFALITVNRHEVEAAAESGDRRAGGVLKAMKTLSTQLSGRSWASPSPTWASGSWPSRSSRN